VTSLVLALTLLAVLPLLTAGCDGDGDTPEVPPLLLHRVSDPGSPLPPLLVTPRVEGERSSGHPRPSWTWDVVADDVCYRVRIDRGPWQVLPPIPRVYTAPVDLAEGDHLFEVQACLARERWSLVGHFDTRVEYFNQPGFWRGLRAPVARTALGHACALMAHNSYVDTGDSQEESFADTWDKIQVALDRQVDVIELDFKDQDGVLLISHNDDGSATGARLVDILDQYALRHADTPLGLEIKEDNPTSDFGERVVDLLRTRREDYVKNGRPMLVRAFLSRLVSLGQVRAALRAEANLFVRPYVRLSVIFPAQGPDLTSFAGQLDQTLAAGATMVELPYRDPALPAKIHLARARGLAVAVWAIPGAFGEVFVTSLREEVDLLTADVVQLDARPLIEAPTSLLDLDAAATAPVPQGLPYQGAPADGTVLAVNRPGQPYWEQPPVDRPVTSGLAGPYLQFDGTEQSQLPYAGSLRAGGGVLISATLRFSDLGLDPGELRPILAQAGGWTLELAWPAGADAGVLRFGVWVEGADGSLQPAFATVPASSLNTVDSVLVTGAYDGDGGVRLWVNNRQTRTEPYALGGIAPLSLPVGLAGDPMDVAGKAGRRFQGDIQRISVHAWGP
jgi:hypothetical protein